MVHVSYRHAEEHIDGIQSRVEQRIVIKEAHFYISDDSDHDTLFVQHSFNIFLDSLIKDRGANFKEHWVWSDGCAGQFKSARSFFWLCRLHRNIKIRHTWSFFESGHGKGEHDGAGACIKRALRRYQMRFDADMMRDAKSVVDWCTHNLCQDPNDRSDKFVRRFFWHITDIDREHAYTCKTVPGTRSLHSIRSTDHTDWVLHIRDHACYCAYCTGNEFQDPCVNIQQGFVEEWRQTILEPLDRVGINQVHIPNEDSDEGSQFSSDYDIILGLVREGMHTYTYLFKY